MKRFLAMALSVLISASLCGCAGEQTEPMTSTPAAPTALPTQTPETGPAPTAAAQDLQGALVDDENCSFSVVSTAVSEYAGMQIEALCVNKTDKTLIFAWTDVSVCGYQYDPLWAQEVAPGAQISSTIDIDTYQLETWGIESVDEISFTLNVFDSEDFMAQPYVESGFEIFPTGLNADTVRYPVRTPVEGEQIVAEEDDAVFIIEHFFDDADGYTLGVYLENGARQDRMFSWEDVRVNGVAVDPMWSEMVSAGKRAYAQVHFPAETLEAQQIETVEQIELTLLVADPDSGEQMLSKQYTFSPGQSTVG